MEIHYPPRPYRDQEDEYISNPRQICLLIEDKVRPEIIGTLSNPPPPTET